MDRISNWTPPSALEVKENEVAREVIKVADKAHKIAGFEVVREGDIMRHPEDAAGDAILAWVIKARAGDLMGQTGVDLNLGGGNWRYHTEDAPPIAAPFVKHIARKRTLRPRMSDIRYASFNMNPIEMDEQFPRPDEPVDRKGLLEVVLSMLTPEERLALESRGRRSGERLTSDGYNRRIKIRKALTRKGGRLQTLVDLAQEDRFTTKSDRFANEAAAEVHARIQQVLAG